MKTPKRLAACAGWGGTIATRSSIRMKGSASVAWLALLVSLCTIALLLWRPANLPFGDAPIVAGLSDNGAGEADRTLQNMSRQRLADSGAPAAASVAVAELSARVAELEDVLPEVKSALERERELLAQANAEGEQLRRLYQQTVQDSVALAALDIEPLLDQAERLLADGSPIQAPISLLKAARERAGRAASAQLQPLIDALDKDREALQVIAQRSVTKAADDLHRLALGLEAMPLQGRTDAGTPAAPATAASPSSDQAASSSAPAGQGGQEAGWLDRLVKSSSELIELPASARADGVVRVTDVGASDLGVLPPAASYFLLENLRLRLLSARLSLLMHDRAGFDADRERALQWLKDHFVQHDDNTRRAISLLTSMQALGHPVVDTSLASSRSALEQLTPSQVPR